MNREVHVLITVLRRRTPNGVCMQGNCVECRESRPKRAVGDGVSGDNKGVGAGWVHGGIAWGGEAAKGASLSSFHEVT